ncbi:hypothetical protein [Histidinibacterium aquaticum]|uniref:Uncharacterized protein n=1 Tax=Histidinibacterium aquaticum TaxID=2613962 RepID=A0A5J5GM75_9RHOB|nr:hypothetical protein [Histidinibacterium aquaticum]KAA9009466.1 hypothetical protein F3S47_09505 [Histidinibacterium aquaticum]
MNSLTPDAAAALTRLRDTAEAYDRSWSFSLEGAVERRMLFFFPASRNATRRIARAATSLGMPETAVRRWTETARDADALGLGMTDTRGSVRLYTQFWDQMVERVQAGDLSPFPVYRGTKALPDGSLRDDAYLCEPMAPTDRILPPLLETCAAFGLDELAVARAFRAIEGADCIFTRTRGAGRDSWLVTVRRAHLDREALASALEAWPLAEAAPDLREAARSEPLLHVAGGTDPIKGRFLSFYFETGADEVSRLAGL